ncbi:unnamed protein product [Sphagnum jensenii]|uniref:Uncharacterized protein n=1 Tax=Sphagnum jensenii TaxID=128206 RepID=A0ABP1A7D1_9BRYO
MGSPGSSGEEQGMDNQVAVCSRWKFSPLKGRQEPFQSEETICRLSGFRPEGSIRGDRDGGERIQTEVGASE